MNKTKAYTAIMHISYATLVLIPATLAAAIQVSDAVSGIADTATVLTNPSVIGPNPSDVASRSLIEGLEFLNSSIQKEDTNVSGDVNIVAGQDVVDDLHSILGGLKDIKEDLTKSLGEAN